MERNPTPPHKICANFQWLAPQSGTSGSGDCRRAASSRFLKSGACARYRHLLREIRTSRAMCRAAFESF